MKLKKPAKDHRGEWDLVLDNGGCFVASVRYVVAEREFPPHVGILWPEPQFFKGAQSYTRTGLAPDEAIKFFANLGVDTAPLEKLMEEKAE